MLTGEGIIASVGHMSARIPDTDTLLINPRFPRVLAEVEDLCATDFGGHRISGSTPIPSETFVRATYGARPDAMSVVHGQESIAPPPEGRPALR